MILPPLPPPAEPPEVSVVMIFRDEERFLSEAVASVFGQTCPDWELLLVDDGSTDDSTRQARELADQHPDRVRYLHHVAHARRGTGASRDLGLREARGRYVAFLDADDVWEPGKLAEQAGLLDRTGVDLVYDRVLEWRSWDPAVPPGCDTTFDLGTPADRRVPALEALARLLENRFQTPTTTGSLVTRRAALDVGGFDADFPGLYEDQAFFAKLLLRTDVWVSGSCTARYRQHSGSTSARVREPYRTGRLRFLRWLRAHLVARPEHAEALALVEAEIRRVRRTPRPWRRRARTLLRRVRVRLSRAGTGSPDP